MFFETYGGADEETKLLARLIAVYIPILILMQAVDDVNEAIAAEAKSNIMRALSDLAHYFVAAMGLWLSAPFCRLKAAIRGSTSIAVTKCKRMETSGNYFAGYLSFAGSLE